eukprot:jgi/Psemu1/6203/gm1.6203_g
MSKIEKHAVIRRNVQNRETFQQLGLNILVFGDKILHGPDSGMVAHSEKLIALNYKACFHWSQGLGVPRDDLEFLQMPHFPVHVIGICRDEIIAPLYQVTQQ